MTQRHILKISRLEGLADGIFAIAMTILVLDLHLPAGILTADLPGILFKLVMFKLFIYMGSFIILGTLWVAMNFQLGLLERINRPYIWINVFYLMVVCVVPFSASLLASYPNSYVSILFYAMNLIFAYLGQLLTIQCAYLLNLNHEDYTPAIRHAVLQRIFVAPIFCVAAIFLAYWNTRIAFVTLLIPTILYMFPGKIDKFDR